MQNVTDNETAMHSVSIHSTHTACGNPIQTSYIPTIYTRQFAYHVDPSHNFDAAKTAPNFLTYTWEYAVAVLYLNQCIFI